MASVLQKMNMRESGNIVYSGTVNELIMDIAMCVDHRENIEY